MRAYYRKKCITIDGKLYTRNGARYVMMRDFVITMYGGKCECCEEKRREFLCMDHRNGGGNKHRRALRGESSYSFLYKNRDTKFRWMRVLCLNCNGARAYRGYCPHEREREAQG